MTQVEWNKSNNECNNDLDYNLDDIRYELSQICSVLHYITNAAFEIHLQLKKLIMYAIRCDLSQTHSTERITGLKFLPAFLLQMTEIVDNVFLCSIDTTVHMKLQEVIRRLK